MSRFVRRSLGLVAFASQPAVAVGEQAAAQARGEKNADSIGGVLERMRRAQPGKSKPAPCASAAAPLVDEVIDADVVQLLDDLHVAVSRVIREAYGVDATTHPR
jgi:hypothetical protein